MRIPSRVTLSKAATDKFRLIKSRTGITPNISARIALMLAIRDTRSLDNAAVSDSDGQILNREVLFGDYLDAYQALLTQFVHDSGIDTDPNTLISALIEIGAFKLGHVKKIQDLVF